MSRSPTRPRRSGGNARVALICAFVFCGMVGAAFASVPLYKKFCQATGFAGAVKRADANTSAVSDQTVTIRFDTNVRGLSWSFEPVQRTQVLKLGESKLAFFRATNTGPVAVTGRALYNVAPQTAGPYFSKLECFCFKNQTIKPGETVEFPVVYYVDPRYAKDPDNATQHEITLSYTFFPATDQSGAKAAAGSGAPRPAQGLGG
ncbi:cytochrome c oxidase assembly protein [Caulobacter sp. KR2-114]|uniref:cytochrome c oxidase assembly protein n=1 Tax=Caulobacter sp. KR2-114 TaxID=3400912 RepID=UPI003C076C8D